MVEAVANMLSAAWGFFSIEWPGLGLTFGEVYLGAFIAVFALGLLRPIIGVGGSLPDAFSRSIRRRPRSEKPKKRELDRDVYRNGETKRHSDGSSTSYHST